MKVEIDWNGFYESVLFGEMIIAVAITIGIIIAVFQLRSIARGLAVNGKDTPSTTYTKRAANADDWRRDKSQLN